MGLADIMQVTSGTKKLVAVLVFLSVCLFIGVFSYYQYINSAEDPRVRSAKKAYKKYGELMEKNRYDDAMRILDEIESVYRSAPGYERSYEVAVALNNRASIYLIQVETLRLQNTEKEMQAMARELSLAEEFTDKAITMYRAWLAEYGGLDENGIRSKVAPFFQASDPALKSGDVKRFLDKRILEIQTAQQETPRRLSVSLTNMGVIARYRNQPEQAKALYEEAVRLWPENYVAKNNLRVLQGLEPEKRGLIEQMFPKERVEK